MRVTEEKDYWNNAALDPEVDVKYIADFPSEPFWEVLGEMKGKVLEVGCGVGRLMKDGYCGIDISEEMLKIARRRKPNCEFKLSDGRTIPYPNKTFDYVYCVLVFQHIPTDGVLFYTKEIRRVLKDEGVFKFQYIEGTEDEPFSKHHKLSLEGFVVKKKKALHPQWTWVDAYKI